MGANPVIRPRSFGVVLGQASLTLTQQTWVRIPQGASCLLTKPTMIRSSYCEYGLTWSNDSSPPSWQSLFESGCSHSESSSLSDLFGLLATAPTPVQALAPSRTVPLGDSSCHLQILVSIYINVAGVL